VTQGRPSPETTLAGIAARRVEVEETRDALYVTLMQFDPELDPRQVGEPFGWLKAYGRGRAAVKRYRLRLDNGEGLSEAACRG
jgi:hypothetical protein